MPCSHEWDLIYDESISGSPKSHYQNKKEHFIMNFYLYNNSGTCLIGNVISGKNCVHPNEEGK